MTNTDRRAQPVAEDKNNSRFHSLYIRQHKDVRCVEVSTRLTTRRCLVSLPGCSFLLYNLSGSTTSGHMTSLWPITWSRAAFPGEIYYNS
uniref:Uncharacterized protein n=1 Tax=Periophthalmus magnuspinnatus TaxID=409849 RepID=A0A3B4AF42_9GOBI